MHGSATRREALRLGVKVIGLLTLASCQRSQTPTADAIEEVKLPAELPVERLDLETKGIEGWTTVEGRWVVEEMAGAPSGKKVLVQRATENEFNVIVAPPGPFTDVDVSMKFTPISGREDASGGIVFRFTDRTYYVIRANALEDNFRLYYYDRGRHQLATATLQPPALDPDRMPLAERGRLYGR